MSDAAPDQEPKPQPKRSGGPPRPPKKTARGLEDDSPERGDRTLELVKATVEAGRVMQLLEAFRQSPLAALNRLERSLDECIVEFSKLLGHLGPEDHQIAMRYLREFRDYRRRHPRLETGDRELRTQAKKVLDEIK